MKTDVLFLSRFNAFCGVSTYTEQLATALSKKKIDVGALSSDFKPRGNGTDVACIIGWTEEGDLDDAMKVILKLDPKVIHIQHETGIFKNTVALAALCDEIRRHKDAKLVLTVHTIPAGLPRPGHDFSRLIRRMDAVIVHSLLSRELVARYPSVKEPARIHHIPHGMLDFVEPIDRTVACRELGLNPSEKIFRLLSMGFVANSKRHMAMLQVMASIVGRHRLAPRDLELVIAGQTASDSGELEGLLKKAVHSFNLENNVHFFSKFIPFDQLKYYYGSADMAVHMVKPPYWAASGSMRTDLSHGLPIIALESKMNGDLKSGVLKVGSTDEMMTRLYQLSRDDQKLLVMRKQAKTFSKKYSWNTVASQHLALYEEICGEKLIDHRQGVRSALFHSSPWLLGSTP